VDDRPASDTPGATPSPISRFDMLLKYAPRTHDGFRRFMCDLSDLVAAERAAERRKLTTDLVLYFEAVEQTRRELEEHR